MNRGKERNPSENNISELVDKAALAVKEEKEEKVGQLVLKEKSGIKIASDKLKRSLTNALNSDVPVSEIPRNLRQISQTTQHTPKDKYKVFPLTGEQVQPMANKIVDKLLETPEMKIILLEKEKATLKAELDEAKKKLKKNARHLVELQSVIVKNRVKNGTQIIFDLNKTWQGGRKTRRKKTNKRKKKRKSKKRKRKKNN